MEMEFYDTANYHHHNHRFKDSSNMLKRPMTLDLNNGPMSGRPLKKQRFAAPVLTSPDLNMLKLASPELEKLIIASQNGIVTTTPTPTQLLFPKCVTEEQEQYARGFVVALEQLHHQSVGPGEEDDSNHGLIVENSNHTIITSNGRTLSTLLPCNATTTSGGITLPVSLAHNGGNGEIVPYSIHEHGLPALVSVSNGSSDHGGHIVTTTSSGVSSYNPPTSLNSSSDFMLTSIKEEPQTVPSLGSSPPLSPIDMTDQERMKLERKRYRNRIAASKCRRRKLERIQKLEDKVVGLKTENTDLTNVVTKLREQVCRLKQQVLDHVKSGCQIMMTSNF